MHRRAFVTALAMAATACATPLLAQEVTLRAVSSFAEKTQFSKPFEAFIEKVNKDGTGIIQINYIGGPRAIPPFEVGNAVRTKVVDIANVTGAFYTNLMPEADAFKLIDKPMSEQRRNGTWEFINTLHNQKLNSWYLARQFHNVPFHIYLTKKIDKLDFTGMKIRVTPVSREDSGTPYGDAVPSWFELYVGLESAAAHLRRYDESVIPGLFQTREYAQAIYRLDRPEASEEDRERFFVHTDAAKVGKGLAAVRDVAAELLGEGFGGLDTEGGDLSVEVFGTGGAHRRERVDRRCIGKWGLGKGECGWT